MTTGLFYDVKAEPGDKPEVVLGRFATILITLPADQSFTMTGAQANALGNALLRQIKEREAHVNLIGSILTGKVAPPPKAASRFSAFASGFGEGILWASALALLVTAGAFAGALAVRVAAQAWGAL